MAEQTVTVKVEGIKEAIAALKTLEFAARRRVSLAAVRAANAVIVRAAKLSAPRRSGALASSTRGRAKLNKSTGTIEGLVRFKSSKAQKKRGVDAFYGHMVIGGTKPHIMPEVIKSKKRGKVKIELARKKYIVIGGKVYSSAMHPGQKANPFMEQVGDAYGHAAVAAFEKKFAERMEVEIQKAKAT